MDDKTLPVIVVVAIAPDVLDALDAWAAEQREPLMRDEALNAALRDWLTSLGRLPVAAEAEEGHDA